MFLLNLICADPSTPQTARALSPAGVPVKGRAGSEDLRCQTGSGPPPRAPHLDLRVLLLQRNHLPLQNHQPSSPACVLTGTLAFVSNLWRCSLSACDHLLRNDRKKNTKTFIRSRLGLLVKKGQPWRQQKACSCSPPAGSPWPLGCLSALRPSLVLGAGGANPTHPL